MALIKDDDILLLNRGGVDYQITVKDIYNYMQAFPWQSWVGGIFHVFVDDPADINVENNSVVHVIDLATSQDVEHIYNPGEFIVLTKPDSTAAFKDSKGTWEFGDFTDTSMVTNMENMFKECKGFTGKLAGNWDTSKVTSMAYMFHLVPYTPKEVGAFDTSSVTWMTGMFGGNNLNDIDIKDWDVSLVTTMSNMFWDTKGNVDISSWDTSSVTEFFDMFKDSQDFNCDISKWDTHGVSSRRFGGVFKNAKAFNQNISQWCVSQVAAPGPGDFCTGSPIETKKGKQPKWGTCPRGEDQ